MGTHSAKCAMLNTDPHQDTLESSNTPSLADHPIPKLSILS